MDFLNDFKRVYIKLLLAAGFMAFGLYAYFKHNSISLKVVCCFAVGIAYLVYGIYTYKAEKNRTR